MDIEEKQEQFVSIFTKYIKRDGSDNLLDWLITTDFFTAPASSKFHSAYEGGLCEHSINVFNRFVKLLYHIKSQLPYLQNPECLQCFYQ